MRTLGYEGPSWAAVATLLIALASANPAIITTWDGKELWDISLNITKLDLLPGLKAWDDLAHMTFQQPEFSQPDGELEIEIWEKLAVLDIASGRLCRATEGCMDDIAGHYQSLWDQELAYLHDDL